MSTAEYQLYSEHKISWVFILFIKHCRGERFEKVKESFKEAMNEGELEEARAMYKKERES